MKNRCRFENFIQLESNQLAYELFISIVGSNRTNANPILLGGQPGIGKTHLLLALDGAVAAQGKPVLYQSGDEFVAGLIESIQNKQQNAFHAFYAPYSLLLLDDVQTLAHKHSTMEELFQFIQKHIPGIMVILAGSFCEQEYIWLTQALKSRFADATTMELGAPNYKERQFILEKQLKAKGISIPSSRLASLAKGKKTIRQLEGAVNSLYAAKALSM